MPSSRPNHIPLVINILRQMRPTSILDVGVGFGKWGLLFREYTDIISAENNPARYQKGNWEVRIDGIEGFPEYLTPVHDYIYDNMYVGNMTTVIDELDPYDVVFAGDVIEHIDKDVGAEFVRKCIAKAKKAVILSTPAHPIAQGPACGNLLEVHRCFWTRNDFHVIGACKTKISEDDILVAVFVPAGVAFPRLTSKRRKSAKAGGESRKQKSRLGLEAQKQWAQYRAYVDHQCTILANKIAIATDQSAKPLDALEATRQHMVDSTDQHGKELREALSRSEKSLNEAVEKMQKDLGETVTSAVSHAVQRIIEGPETKSANWVQKVQSVPHRNKRNDADGILLSLPFGNATVAIRLPRHGVSEATGSMPAQPGAIHGTNSRPEIKSEYCPQEGAGALLEPGGRKISVIMTTYNSSPYVRKSVLNVLEQSHRDIEVIVVDDASSDNTFEIVSQIARDDSRVRPIKMFRNRGTYWCKNYGITRATGRYITFQDSDDISDRDRLRLQLQELQQTQAVMCTCNYVRVDDAGTVVLNRGREQRKAIMAPLLDKEAVIRRAGYFDSVRTSADDEFNRRVGIAFGHERICHIDAPLYRATVREGSLTNDARTRADISIADGAGSDQSFLSAPRREYVRQYTAWHERLKTGAEGPLIQFPQLRRRFPAPARLLPEMHQQESYVTASMASIPVRETLLQQTVASILPQIDFLNIYLNGYDRTPLFLLNDKIQVIHSREYGDLRDNGKFFFLDSILHGYHFTIDDDIIYPSDYVQKMILKIEQYDRQAIVGCHGVILADPIIRFMAGRKVFHFKQKLERDKIVNLLGTGTTAYHTSAILLSLADFEQPGMADVWLAIAAKRQNIPLIAIQRPDGWLVPLAEAHETSLFAIATKEDQLQTRLITEHGSWNLDDLCPSLPLIRTVLHRFTREELASQGVDIDRVHAPSGALVMASNEPALHAT